MSSPPSGSPIEGVIIIDKPAGPTSHDVVFRMRRVLRERRIGHTGTLDPAATGVLPLVVGRATRLARFMSAGRKAYSAGVRLGIVTDSYDAEGTPVGPAFEGPWPTPEQVERALEGFRGTFMQTPPLFSAKKVDGQRLYKRAHADAKARARRREAARALEASGTQAAANTVGEGAEDADDGPSPVPTPQLVTIHRLDLVSCDGPDVELELECSAGFYVRSLAFDLGQRLGTGAHLGRLRRTRSGDFDLTGAVPLATAELDPDVARAALIPLDALLPDLPAVVLSEVGVRYAVAGRDIGPAEARAPWLAAPSPFVRLLSPGGQFLAVAEPSARPGFLHPSIVLG